MTRLLLIDDHVVVAESLVASLRQDRPDWSVRSASSAQEAIGLLQSEPADVAILDLYLPDTVGYDLADRLLEMNPAPSIVLFSGQLSAADMAAARDRAITALVSKADRLSCLYEAVDAVFANGEYVSPALEPLRQSLSDSIPDLTPRMAEVLGALNEGLPNKEIAHRLNVSMPTVSFHLKELRQRLGATTNRELLVIARQIGLVS